MIPARASIHLDARPSWEFRRDLEDGWARGLANGVVVYDPARAEGFESAPYRFHFLPERIHRPGATSPSLPPREGLYLPHAPCPFDGPEFVREREIVRLERAGRLYHVVANRFPVTSRHFLGVRGADADAAILPQRLHGPGEIADAILALLHVGPPYRAYFNSLRGADDSQSGSSVNHWHFQFFEFPAAYASPCIEGRARSVGDAAGLARGVVEDWPAHHEFLEFPPEHSEDAAIFLWGRIERVHEVQAAYNMEVAFLPSGRLRAFLFPRAPGPLVELEGAGKLSANFGGWELSGDIVIPTREIFDWIRKNPERAVRMTHERLSVTTRPVP